MSLVKELYYHLPIFFQNCACSLYGWKEAKIRYNQTFKEKLNFLLQSENWSKSEIEAYQNEQLRNLVKYAYTYVPYYREVMDNLKLSPQDIKTTSDLYKLPILQKEEINKNFKKFLSTDASSKDIILTKTSGTTGKSLYFYKSKKGVAFQWAIWWRHRKRFGVDFGSKHVNFTGKIVVSPSQNNPPFWRWNYPFNQAIINMQHIIPTKISYIVDFLNNNNFVFYSGYPSVIHSFCAIANEKKLNLTSLPKFIFPGAENILDYQKKEIEEYTKAVIADQYGFSEGCGNASQCLEFNYHEDFEYGILECVDQEIDPLTGRIKGKIICTGFSSFEFPFIRYEIGDIGIWENPKIECKCGRKSKVIVKIEGRIDDFVITPEGHRVMRFDYIFKDTKNVREAQIIQNKLGEITVVIVRREHYSTKDEKYIKDEIAKWISPKLNVVFQYVDEIPRNPNGKFQAVKSYIKGG